MKRLSIFGSTGSIGTQTLEVVRAFPSEFEVVALSAGRNLELLRRQIEEFHPKVVAVAESADLPLLASSFPSIEFLHGSAGLVQMAKLDVDVCMMAIVGFAALSPALEATKTAKTLAIANKESLVVAGALMQAASSQSGCKLLPVDSEHNGLFQLLEGVNRDQVRTLVLTASGGPLWRRPELPLSEVTPEIAVKHPNWNMGAKISVDSATLMNKGLELIEASFLFQAPSEAIEVWVHPQSIVHAALWLTDNTCLAQLGVPDMRAAIGHTLSYPNRLRNVVPKLGLDQMSKLEFFPPDEKRFPCLGLARKALQNGAGHLVALNAANEIAVSAFLERRLSFARISEVVERVLEQPLPRVVQGIEEIISIDGTSRQVASSLLD